MAIYEFIHWYSFTFTCVQLALLPKSLVDLYITFNLPLLSPFVFRHPFGSNRLYTDPHFKLGVKARLALALSPCFRRLRTFS